MKPIKTPISLCRPTAQLKPLIAPSRRITFA